MQGLHRLTARDCARDVRTHDRAAVDECRVRDGELERRHLEIALADRQVDRLPLVPRLMLRGAEPGRGRDEPRRLSRNVEARRVSEAQATRPALDPLAPVDEELVAEPVEPRAPRLPECGGPAP